jgi:hypothetical protein
MPDNVGQDVDQHVQTESWFYITFLKVIYMIDFIGIFLYLLKSFPI